jgi:hypothetical protein
MQRKGRARGSESASWHAVRIKACSTAAFVLWGSTVLADPQPQTISGVPQQIIPMVGEVGVPIFTIPAGTVSTLGASTAGTVSAGTGTSTDSSALDTMLGMSWGASAQQSAQALGVNASALAATCVVESGCQNVAGTGSITGAFQMTAATYQASLCRSTGARPEPCG